MSLIDELKEIDIVSYLTSKGYPIAKATESKVWFCSPFRNEEKPSFVVFKNSNVWCDYGKSSRTASIIDLVQELNNCDTTTAMRVLRNEEDTERFEPIDVSKEPLLTVSKSLPRYISPDLLMYLSSRGISEPTYSKYTNECHYWFKDNPERIYRAVGFKNDSSGWELRNGIGHKYATSPKDITSFTGNGHTLNLWEGMFDYMSAIEYFGEDGIVGDRVVANGLGMIYRILDKLNQYEKINIFLDNGDAVDKTITLIKSVVGYEKVYDRRDIFEGKKDFNEFWCSINNKNKTI